ncbi:hypothetical protein KI387_016439, partial [Taxus chinensis]
TATSDPPYDLCKEVLDDSLIDYMLGIDNRSHVHTNSSPSQTTYIVPSHESPTFDLVSHHSSHTSSHTPSYYVDDPIDSMINDIITSESLGDVNDTADRHDSPTFNSIERESLSPLSLE